MKVYFFILYFSINTSVLLIGQNIFGRYQTNIDTAPFFEIEIDSNYKYVGLGISITVDESQEGQIYDLGKFTLQSKLLILSGTNNFFPFLSYFIYILSEDTLININFPYLKKGELLFCSSKVDKKGNCIYAGNIINGKREEDWWFYNKDFHEYVIYKNGKVVYSKKTPVVKKIN